MKIWILNTDGTLNLEYDVPRSPLEDGQFLLPALPYMEVPPPLAGENKVAVAVNREWEIMDDFRGVEYWIDGDRFTIDAIGETVPEGASLNPPPLVPTSISTAQGHLALIEYGKYQAAVNFINAIPDPVEKLKAEVNFYRRNDWQRDNQTLLALAQGLGISDAELDQMFIFGSKQ